MNEKLGNEFGENVKNIQEMLHTMNTELESNKVKLSQVEKDVADVTMKVEVDRCVQEMVSWVSEQMVNQQVVENLNKVAKKVN